MSPLLLWFPPALRRCRGCLIIAEAGAKGVPFVTACCLDLVILHRLGGTGVAYEHVDIPFSLKSGCFPELQ
jgi:hypothetical protein